MVRTIAAVEEARELASEIMSPRERPIVVISTHAHDRGTDVDPAVVAREVQGVADVTIVVTGPATMALDDALPDKLCCFNGAARSYPADLHRSGDWRRSPLRFPGVGQQQQVIDDAHDQAQQSDIASTSNRSRFTHTLADQLGGVVLPFVPRDERPATEGERAPEAAAPPRPAAPRANPAPPRPAVPTAPKPATPALAPAALAVAAEPSKVEQAEASAIPEPQTAAERRTALQDTQMRLLAANAEIERLRGEVQQLRHGQPTLVPRPTAVLPAVRTVRVVEQPAPFSDDSRVASLVTQVERLRGELSSARQEAQRLTKRAGSATGLRREDRRGRWASDEDWIRHEVYLAWVERVHAQERSALALPSEYVVGERFAPSLEQLDDAQFDKAMKCVVDVLTDTAKDSPARAVHALRAGEKGAPARVRDGDGAKCMRAYVEHNVASARRLHYWVAPGGRIELERVVLHDDMEP